MSIESDITEAEAARTAILQAMTLAAGVVEYTIGARTVKTDPEAALRAIKLVLRELYAQRPSRRNGGRSYVGFGRA